MRRYVTSLVLILALLVQTVSPAVTLAEEPPDPRAVILLPDENGIPIYGDDKFITVTGDAVDGAVFPEMIHFFDTEIPLNLPDGEYIVSANLHNLYGTVDENSMPNYFLSQGLSITAETPVNTPVHMAGDNLGLLTLQPPAASNYIISAISIFPEGQEKAAIMYTQKAGGGVRKVRITPGTYTIVAALSDQSTDDTNTYFLEKQIAIGANQSVTLTMDDNFTSALSMEKSSFDKGDKVTISHIISDSYGNRLIGKAKDLPITHDGEETSAWVNEAPFLKILNASNEEIYRVTNSGNNRPVFGQWNRWNEFSERALVEKPDTETTFYSGEYQIPADIPGGIFTVKIELGEGSYTHAQNPASFIIRGEESAPVLDSLASPTNAEAITVTGTATPGLPVDVHYSLDGGEKILIGTAFASAETGRFSVNFTPLQEGNYRFTAGNSQPVELIVDWTAPAPPLNLAGDSSDAGTIALTWEAPEGEAIAKYEVYRNGTRLTTVNTPGYTDSGLVNDTEYQYQVVAIDRAGNGSEPAELSMFTKVVPQLMISSVNWRGSWDRQNHLNMGSNIHLTISGTPEVNGKAVLEYMDQSEDLKTEEALLAEKKDVEGKGTGIYTGSLSIPEGAKSITKITGSIEQGEYKEEMEAVNLPAPINGSLKVQLSAATLEEFEELKGAELSLWSKAKGSGSKVLISDEGEYVFSGLVPGEDYELKLVRGQKALGAHENISILGGTLSTREFDFNTSLSWLDIRVVDKAGEPIANTLVQVTSSGGALLTSGYSGQDGWVRSWADRGKAENAPLVKDCPTGETLKLKANVQSYFWEQYQSPATATKTLAPGGNEIIIEIPDRPAATLKGAVRMIDGSILKGAGITAYTKIGDFEIQRTTSSDADGNYELGVIAGQIRLVVTHRLAGSKEYIIDEALKRGEERDYPIYFPLEKRITLNMKSKNIGEADYYTNPLIEPFIEATVTNKRTGKTAKVYGDWLAVTVPDAEPGDEIEITVDGSKAGYSKKTIHVELDKDSWAGAEIKLDEMGKIKALPVDAFGRSFTEQRVYAQIYRVDPVTDELSYVAQNSSASLDLITESLPAGRYTIVFHTYPTGSVMTYERLLEYLEDNAFVKEDLEVTDGEVFNIGNVTVAKFEERRGWYFFKGNEGNGFRASANETSPGRLVTLTANFSYESDITRIRNDRFYMTIPEDTEYVEDSLVIKLVEGSRGVIPYVGKEEGFIELTGRSVIGSPLPKIEGSATYQVRISDEPKTSNIVARFWAEFRSGDEDFKETIGEVSVKAPYLSLYVDSTINDRQVPISGQAPANATVKIYDSSYYLGQVVAGNNGLWKTNVVLPDRGNNATHYLRAETGESGLTVYSEIQPVYYDPNQPRITRIEFGQTGVFKKEIKRGSTFRYLWDREKDHELDVYFDDVSRIEDFKVLSGNGTVVAERDQITYSLSENKASAVWKTPVITDEIRISYRIIKAPFRYPEDYKDLPEDVLRSNLPPLFRDATVLSAETTYNQETETFVSNSKLLLSDGYTALNTTFEISDYEGTETLAENGLPIKLLSKTITEGNRADTFEFDFIIDRDVILNEVPIEKMAKQSGMGIQAVKGVAVAAKSAIQYVKMKGALGAVTGGNKLYEIYDTFMTGFNYGKQSDDLDKLRATVDGPCFEPTMREYYRTEILKAEIDLKFSTGYKVFSSIAMNVAAKVVPAGWIAEGVSIGTSATGSVIDNGMDEVTETTYKDLKHYIDQWTFLTCRRSKDDPNDSGSDGGKQNRGGPDGGGIGTPVPVGLIDPSGYLYEGVEENRLAGVMTTAFERIDGEWTFWDAEWFAQENPLITDEEGRYQWDVPEGLWKVMYEKEGYEVTFSEELPVPPPQLEVNIGMISLARPTVEISAEYGGVIKLTFDKYMDPTTIGNTTFKVFEKELDAFGNQVPVAGSIQAVEAKADPKDATKQLARIIKFTPDTFRAAGGEYAVWVSDMVRDYGGKTMAEAATGDVIIPERPLDPGRDRDKKKDMEEPPVGEQPIMAKGKTLTLRYEAKPNEDVNALVVYKRDEQGNLEIVKASAYDPVTRTMRFIGEEGGDYIVGHHPKSFHDTNMWAKDAISYLAARGIIDGVGDGKFEPQRRITRAEFIKILVSIAVDIDSGEYGDSGYKDVKSDAWYAKYISWATKNGVASGYEDESFRPEDPITREQMALVLSNFGYVIGLKLEAEKEGGEFADADRIGSWAEDAIRKMQEAGIIHGKTGGIYDPKGYTTRAEAAQVVAGILARYLNQAR